MSPNHEEYRHDNTDCKSHGDILLDPSSVIFIVPNESLFICRKCGAYLSINIDSGLIYAWTFAENFFAVVKILLDRNSV